MSKDATLQIRIDSELKKQVEELYRSLGTSFAEAVRIFAQQSVMEGGMPFLPSLKRWEDITEAELQHTLEQNESDIAAGNICSQAELDAKMMERFSNG